MQRELRILIALALAAHGVGHTVGFGVGAPLWFAAVWIVPGVGFVVGAWSLWKHMGWWPPLVLVSAIASLALEALAGVSLQPGPYASAAVFNTVAMLALFVPRTRQHLANM